VIATIGGHPVTWPLVEKYLWPTVRKDYKAAGTLFHPKGLTWLTGMVERALYMTAVYFDGVQWIGVWLGIKVIARWQSEEQKARKGEYSEQAGYEVWLIGSGISLACAFTGAWAAKGQAPNLK
jgi:hypothetical protein